MLDVTGEIRHSNCHRYLVKAGEPAILATGHLSLSQVLRSPHETDFTTNVAIAWLWNLREQPRRVLHLRREA